MRKKGKSVELVVMMFILATTAICLLVWPTSVVTVAAAGVLAVLGASLAIELFFGRRPMSLTAGMSVALMAGYGGGAFNTFLSLYATGVDPFRVIAIPVSYVAYGFLMVYLASIMLLLAMLFEPPLFRSSDQIVMSRKLERFLWVATLLIAIAYYHGDISYQGTTVEAGTARVSILGMIVSSLPFIVLPLIASGIAQTRGWQKRRMIFLTLLLIIMIFPLGRRSLFYSLFIAAFTVLNLSGRKYRITTKQIFFIVSLLVSLIIISNYLFIAIRLSMDEINSRQKGNYLNAALVDVIPRTVETVLYRPDQVMDYLSDNLRTRTFVVGYLALLGRGGITAKPMLGQDALFCVQLITPDIFYKLAGSDKTEIRRTGSEETLINERFGLPVYDDANSVLTAGFADFGLLGVALYPLLICAIPRILLWMCDAAFEPLVGTSWRLLLLMVYFQTEVEMDGYLGCFRDMAYVAVLWSLVGALPYLAASTSPKSVEVA